MGLLDALLNPESYGGQGGGLLDFLRAPQRQQAPSFAERFPDDMIAYNGGPEGMRRMGIGPSEAKDRFSAAFQPSPNEQSSPLDNALWPAGPNIPRPSATIGGRSFDGAQFDPQTYAPNQAQPIAVGNYQMPRIGDAQQYIPQPGPQGAAPPQVAQAPQQPAASTDISAQSRQPQASQELPPALGGGGYLDRVINGGGLVRSLFPSAQQQNLSAQYKAVQQTLVDGGMSLREAQSKAMLAVMNPEAGKTILQEALTNKEKYQKIGMDGLGNEQYGFVNERDQTVNGKALGADGSGGGAAAGGGFLAPGVKGIDSTLTGKDYLGQFSPEVQAAVQNYVDGKSMPTGNPRKGFTQTVKMIAQKYGSDMGQSVDDTTYSARRTMRNQLSSSAPSSLGGQINIGNTAAGHLADLTQKALELGNVDTGIAPLTSMVNNARGLGTEQAAKMEALKGAAQHYGQEITKFYAGSPGGVAERDRFIESVNGARSPKELAAILATEGELMRSRLDALGGQIKGVLGDEGLKQYPVLRPDGQEALKKVEENVSRLKGGQGAATSGGIQEGATATNPQTGQKITFRNGKWQ